MNSPSGQDPLQFLKSLWGQMGIPFAGMITPTLDVGELEKRIGDLKSVQNWLTMNLSMVQATIQGLEMQKATLSMIRQGISGKPPESSSRNPMVDIWWDLIQAQMKQANATQGNATQGNATQGNATQGHATQGNATQGNATQGDAIQGDASQGNTPQRNAQQGRSQQDKDSDKNK